MTTTTPDWLPLETERLLLRDFRKDDVDAVHVYAIDPEVIRYMDWGPNTLEVTHEVIDRNIARQASWPRTQLDPAGPGCRAECHRRADRRDLLA